MADTAQSPFSDPKEEMIAAAEVLLAIGGPQKTTVRAITQAAGVNVGAINYHFGSRDGLMTLICNRHMHPANERILADLQTLEFAVGPEAVREIFRPLVVTALTVWRNDDVLKGLRNFMFVDAALAQKLNVSSMSQVYEQMQDALGEACPGLTPGDVRRRFRFAMATIMHVVRSHDGNVKEMQDDGMVEDLLGFLTGGFTYQS